ncbi:MAG: CHAD domain-containing protein [Candidatus Omnitrophota bacterium]
MKQPNFAQQTILNNLEDFLIQKEGIILNRNPDALHRMRVSGRRLRISLWSFKLFFPDQEYNKMQNEIRKICKPLNRARDLDTQIAILLKLKAQEYIIRHFKEQRVKLQPRISQDLAKIDKLHLRERINERLKNSKVLFNNPALIKTGKEKINKRLKELLWRTDYAYCPKDLTKLHSLRIAAKHLRYTLELFQPIYAKRLNSFISNSRLIQKTLGDMRNYLILSESPVLNNHSLKIRLISLGNKSYAKFKKIWENQPTWRNFIGLNTAGKRNCT